MTRMKADLLEARRSASDAEARLRPLGESVQLYKQKYQTCVSKIAELESTLQSHEEDRRQSRAQVCLTVSEYNVRQRIKQSTNSMFKVKRT